MRRQVIVLTFLVLLGFSLITLSFHLYGQEMNQYHFESPCNYKYVDYDPIIDVIGLVGLGVFWIGILLLIMEVIFN